MNPGWMVSKTFFFGLRRASGVASKDEKRSVSHNEVNSSQPLELTLELLALEVYPLSGLTTRWWTDELDACILAFGRSGLKECVHKFSLDFGSRAAETKVNRLTQSNIANDLTPRMFAGLRLHYTTGDSDFYSVAY